MAEIDVSGNEFHDAVSLSSALISWSDWKTALASDLLFFSDATTSSAVKVVSRQRARTGITNERTHFLMERAVCGRRRVKQASHEIRNSGAHAPPFPNFQTGMPSFFALSARFPWMPVPGKTMTPIGRMSSI
jgi:hypothetical protein